VKIRFSEKQVRIRIHMDDAQKWVSGEGVEMKIDWPLHVWKIALTLDDTKEFSIHEPAIGEVIISVDSSYLAKWLDTDEESMEFEIGTWKILIQKDYTCEHKIIQDARTFTRPNEITR